MGCQVTRQPDVQWGRWQHANTKCPISLLSRENIDAGNGGKSGERDPLPGPSDGRLGLSVTNVVLKFRV